MMNEEQIRALLPIGSVVLLEGAEKSLVIIGIKQTNAETNEEFDYLGVLYPEGFVSDDMKFLFNQKDIIDVQFRGYENEERETFVDNLVRYYNLQNGKNA